MRAARLSRGMTLLALARECERRGAPLSEGHASRIERGFAIPRPGLRVALADVLALDPLTLKPLVADAVTADRA